MTTSMIHKITSEYNHKNPLKGCLYAKASFQGILFSAYTKHSKALFYCEHNILRISTIRAYHDVEIARFEDIL